jgi:hypothetical protein
MIIYLICLMIVSVALLGRTAAAEPKLPLAAVFAGLFTFG